MDKRKLEEKIFKVIMVVSLCIVMGALFSILGIIFVKGASSLSVGMVTQTPTGGYYLGGGGGILNAIVGSLYLAAGGTLLAFFISLGVALYLQKEFAPAKVSHTIRFMLDVMWGIPPVVYGVFCFIIMIFLGIGTSLLGGIIALTLIEIPIMTRMMDESISNVPLELKEASYSLGSTKLDAALYITPRQALPGIISGVLIAFGRAVGTAAPLLYTTGTSNHIPSSLFDSAHSLPVMIFELTTSPIPEVRDRAYAAAFILLSIVLVVNLISRKLTKRVGAYVIR